MELKENKISISSIPLNLAGSHEARQMQNMLYFLVDKFPQASEKIRFADDVKQSDFLELMRSQAPEKLVNNFLGFLLDMNFVNENQRGELQKGLIQAASQSGSFDTPINLQDSISSSFLKHSKDSFISSTSQSLSENNTNQCRMISTQNRLGKELIYSKHQFEKSSPQKKNSKATSEKQHAFILFKTEVFYKDQGQKKQLAGIFKEKMKKHIQILLTKLSFQRLYYSQDMNLKIPVTVHIVTNYPSISPLANDLQQFFELLNQKILPIDNKKCRSRVIYNNLPPSNQKAEASKELSAVSVNAAFLALTFSLDILLASIKKKLPFQQNSNLPGIYENLLQLNEKLKDLRQTAEQSGKQKDQLAFIRSLQSACEQFDFKIIDELAKVHPSLGQRLQLLKNVANLASDQEYVESGEWIKSKALQSKTVASPEALEINIAALLNESGFALEVAAPENSTLYSEINFHLAGIYQFVAENDRMPQLRNQAKWEEFKESYQPKPNQVLIKPFQFDEKQVVKYLDYTLDLKNESGELVLTDTTTSVKISCSPYQPQLINRLLAEKIGEKKLSLRQIRELNDFVFMGREMTLSDCQRILGEGIQEKNLSSINQHNQGLFSIYATGLAAEFEISNLSPKAEKLLTAPIKDLDVSIWQLRQVIGSLKAEAFRKTGGQKQLPEKENEKTQAITYLYLEAYKMHHQQAGVLGDRKQQGECQQVLKNPQSKEIKKLEKLAKNSFSNLPDEKNERLIHQLEQRYVALQWYQSQLAQIKKLELVGKGDSEQTRVQSLEEKIFKVSQKLFNSQNLKQQIEQSLQALLASPDLKTQMQQAAQVYLKLKEAGREKHPLAILCKGFVEGYVDLFGLSPTQEKLFEIIAAGKFETQQSNMSPSAFFQVMPSFYEANSKAFEKGDVKPDMMRYLAHAGQMFDLDDKNAWRGLPLSLDKILQLVDMFNLPETDKNYTKAMARLQQMLPQCQAFLPRSAAEKNAEPKAVAFMLLHLARYCAGQLKIYPSTGKINTNILDDFGDKIVNHFEIQIDTVLGKTTQKSALFSEKNEQISIGEATDTINVNSLREKLQWLQQMALRFITQVNQNSQDKISVDLRSINGLDEKDLKKFCDFLVNIGAISPATQEQMLADFKLAQLNQLSVDKRIEQNLNGVLDENDFDPKPILKLADAVLFRSENRIYEFFNVLKQLENYLEKTQLTERFGWNVILRYFINHVMQGLIADLFSGRYSASEQIDFLIGIYENAEKLNTQFEQPIKVVVCELLSQMTGKKIELNKTQVKQIFQEKDHQSVFGSDEDTSLFLLDRIPGSSNSPSDTKSFYLFSKGTQNIENNVKNDCISFNQFKKQFENAKQRLTQEKGVTLDGEYAPEDHGGVEITLPTLTKNQNIGFGFKPAQEQKTLGEVYVPDLLGEGDFSVFGYTDRENLNPELYVSSVNQTDIRMKVTASSNTKGKSNQIQIKNLGIYGRNDLEETEDNFPSPISSSNSNLPTGGNNPSNEGSENGSTNNSKSCVLF